ncbi:MAG: right-handed parallel beta-helix repeat-containing protein [Planctomycetales bacterium]
MSKMKRKIFAGLLLSWAALNPAFAQGPGSAGTAMLEDSPVVSAPQANPGVAPAPAPYGGAPYGGGYTTAPGGNPYGGYQPFNPPQNYGASVPSYANDPAYSNESYVPYNPWGIRSMTRSDIGNGLGYETGYQTFGGLIPIPLNPGYSILFVNTRGIVGYDGTDGFNGGAGFRWFNPDIERVFGGSFWYDYDDRRVRTYEQLGFSVESLGTYLDFRMNGYFPTNSDQTVLSKNYTGEVFFINHNVGLGQRTVVQESLRGGDVEMGGALPGIGDFGLRAYAGAYYYDGNGTNSGQATGFKGRLEAMVTEDLWVQLGVTNDKFFGTNTTMAVTLFLPDGAPSRILSRQPTQERLYVPVERNYRVAVHQHILDTPELAINPRTGLPFYIDHVDNNAFAGGNGSVENPYSSLPASRPASTDIIFVHTGDGTSRNMDGGITLADYQRLLGEGIPHFITATQGTFELPGNNSGNIPTITNLGGDAVTLASHNEVSGFRIEAPAGNGIYGSGITDFNINNVNVTNAGLNGIQLVNVTNTPGTPGIIDRVSAMDSGLNGVEINNNNGASVDVTITDVAARRNVVGVEILAANASTVNVDMNRIDVSQNSVGAELAASGNSTINANVNAMLGNSNSASGFEVHGSQGTILLDLAGSEFRGNGTNGLLLEGLNLSHLTANLAGNNFSDNLNNGLFVQADNSQVDLTSNGDLFNTNLLNGLAAVVDHSGLLNASITNGSFNGNDGRGLYVVADHLSTLNMLVQGSSFDDNNIAGAEIGLNNGAQTSLGLRFTGSTFRNNLGVGFGLTSTDANYNGGLGLVLGGPSATNDGNIFDNNVGAAIAINQVGSGTGMFTIQNNTITRTQNDSNATDDFLGDGINVRLTGAAATSSLVNSLIDGNIIGSLTDDTQAVAGRGIFVSALGSSEISNLSVTSNIIARAGSDGMVFQRFTKATIDNIIIDGNIINRSVGNGLFIVASGSNTDDAFNPLVDDYTINANQITSSGINGIRMDVRSDAVLQANITNNTITGSGSDGIDTREQINDSTDLRQVRGTWTGNQITGNANNGILLTAAMDLVIGQNGVGLGNEISNNGNDGIQADGSGSVEINNNVIAQNTHAGVRLQAFLNSASLVNNLITLNGGDGLAILKGVSSWNDEGGTTTWSLSGFQLNVVAIDNTISSNTGRGVNVLNQMSNIITLQMGDGTVAGGNIIENNGLEGIYAVNTSSGTQSQDANATDPLAADGSINETPIMVLDLQYNTIRGNGALSDFISTRLRAPCRHRDLPGEWCPRIDQPGGRQCSCEFRRTSQCPLAEQHLRRKPGCGLLRPILHLHGGSG